jgi:hypothetical protein
MLLLSVILNGSRGYPASCPMGTGGKHGKGVKLTTHLQLVPSQEYEDLYIHSPIHLHEAALVYLSAGTILCFYATQYFLVNGQSLVGCT